MDTILDNDALRQATVAAAYVLLGTQLLASSMFVAYAARILRKWKGQDQ